MANFITRWATDAENRQVNNGLSNAAVIDGTTRGQDVVCFTSPMMMANRIAGALNLVARFSVDELGRISAALTSDHQTK